MKKLLFLLAAVALAASAAAQNEYAEIARLRGLNRRVAGIRSMNDGEHYTALEGNDIVRYAYAAEGPSEKLLPASAAGLRITDYAFSPDEKRILVASGYAPIYRHSYTTKYYLVEDNSCRPVLPEAEAPRDASFSPDGSSIVYSDRNDLYLYDIASGHTRRLTADGEWNAVINGTTDWVYEEEFGFTQAYAFSPDSRRVAFLRFDERAVPLMQMMRFDGKLHNEAFSFKYPKAGETNSTMQLFVVDLATGQTERIDTGAETDQYIPRIGFTPDGKLWFHRLNRRQNTFELVLCEPHGAQRTIYEERAQQYVERVDDNTITFVDKDRFLVRQESHTGFMHLYLYGVRSGFIAQVTKGPWEVTEVVGVTPKRVWFLSTETSPLRRNLYSAALNGKDKRRLTTGEGCYAIAPSKGMKYYISTFSSATTPNRIEVCTGDGKPVRTLAASTELEQELAASGRPAKEFFTFVTERGDTLNAYIVRPRDFDPSRRYPVLLTQYSGPGSQTVADRWSLDWEDALVVRPPHGRPALGRQRAHRHLRLVVRRLHGRELRPQRAGALQNGHRRGPRHLVALLRHHLHRNLQQPAAVQRRRLRRQFAHPLRAAARRPAHAPAAHPRHGRRQRPLPEHGRTGPCAQPRRQAVRHDGLSRPEPLDAAERYVQRAAEDDRLHARTLVVWSVHAVSTLPPGRSPSRRPARR